jgi:hypothetical protein
LKFRGGAFYLSYQKMAILQNSSYYYEIVARGYFSALAHYNLHR